MRMDLLICSFFVYAAIGYIVEVLYCSLFSRRFVNRGFLHGPYLPIYGFGALLVIYLFGDFSSNPLLLFVLAMIGTSALEYLTSYLLEQFFHTKLWDYSHYRFQIRGRVCLLNSTLFGLLGLCIIYIVNPVVLQVLVQLDDALLATCSHLIILIIAVDTTSSVFRMASFQKQITEFRLKKAEIEERLHILSRMKSSKALEGLRLTLDTELEELRGRLNASAKRILDAFPSITSSNEEKRQLFEVLKHNAEQVRAKEKALRARLKEIRRKQHDKS